MGNSSRARRAQPASKPYPAIDYMHGKHKPRIIEVEGGFRAEIVTTWPDIELINWTGCPHIHRTRRGAERCLFAWNDYAHDERQRILREANGL